MTQLNIRNTLAGTVGADEVAQNFGDTATVGAADTVTDILNGNLGQDNLQRRIGWEDIRRGSLFRGYSVGGTNSLDYFASLFGKSTITPYDAPQTSGINVRGWIPIPGLAIKFYVPKQVGTNRAFIQWSVNWLNDGILLDGATAIASFAAQQDDSASVLGLFVDGLPVSNAPARALTFGVAEEFINKDADANDYNQYYGHGDMGYTWSGHYIINKALTPGWHTVSVRLQAHKDIPQTRIRTRNMRVLIFR